MNMGLSGKYAIRDNGIRWKGQHFWKTPNSKSVNKEPKPKKGSGNHVHTEQHTSIGTYHTTHQSFIYCFWRQELCVPFSFLYLHHLSERLTDNKLLIKMYLIKSSLRKNYEITLFCDIAQLPMVYILKHPHSLKASCSR